MGQSPPPRTRVWIARSAYTYFHLPMIAGIIAVAAADELMVAHSGNRGTAASVALTIRGIALFFAGHALFKWAVFGVTPESIERPGLLVTPALGAPSEGASLRTSSLYLAVDLIYEGLSVLVLLLIDAQLLEVLGGKAIELLRDICDG